MCASLDAPPDATLSYIVDVGVSLTWRVRVGGFAIALATSACSSPPSHTYAVPVTPYGPMAPPNAGTPWPIVPVNGTPTTATAWPTATPTGSPTASPVPTGPQLITIAPPASGPIVSADPEIDGPAEVADVEIGPISMIGGSVPDVSATAARMHGSFRRCYRPALVMNFKTQGDLRLSAQIGDKGQVIDAEADDVNGLPQTVVTCIVERLAKQTFSRPTVIPTGIRIPLKLLPLAPNTPVPSVPAKH